MLKRRSALILMMVLLVAMVLGGPAGPREACADCIDGCIWDAQQCRSWCPPQDWSCLNACDEGMNRCISYCSP